MEKKWEWVSKKIASLGLNQTDLALKVGWESTRISELLADKRNIPIKCLVPFADVLGVDLRQLTLYNQGKLSDLPLPSSHNLMLDSRTTTKTLVLGIVEAGRWKESIEFPKSDIEEIDFPTPQGYSANDVFALKVRGESMNKKFTDGSFAVCVSINGCPNISSGKYVVAQRKRAGFYETTVKRLDIRDDGSKWLIPESTDSDFLPIKINGSEMEEIKIIAVVLAAYQKV